MDEDALRAEDVAEILGIGRNAVYALAKSGELGSYRIGRKLRFTAADVQRYIERSRAASAGALRVDGDVAMGASPSPMTVAHVTASAETSSEGGASAAAAPMSQGELASGNPAAASASLSTSPFVFSGGDIVGDVAAHHLGLAGLPVARSYVGSYQALVELYLGRADAAFVHLFDRKTNSYNLASAQRLAPGTPLVLLRLVRRSIGLAVASGNPKRLRRWSDLLHEGVVLANAPRGSGERVLLDEKLIGLEARPSAIEGYGRELSSTAVVPLIVAKGGADVGVCTRQLASQTCGVDFVPMQDEWLDVAVAKTARTRLLVRGFLELADDEQFKAQLAAMGFDASHVGAVVYEC